MTSKIKVDNINKVSDDSNIINKCGTTITLGASGDSIALASGASQTGFGRTGTVDWQTTPKTATFTAVNGEGYFCNTTAGSFEVDLPAGSAGAIVSIQDYNNTFDSYSLSVDPNGSERINGGAAGATVTLSTEGLGITFVYIDSTVGWRSVQSNEYSTAGENPVYVAASGGNSCGTTGDYKYHVFTGPGTLTVSCAGNAAGSNSIDYMIVGDGGGGGGSSIGGCYAGGGGGGAGGWRASSGTDSGSYTAGPSPLTAPVGSYPVSATTYPISIGGGGSGGPPTGDGSNGTGTSALGFTSAGGGFGARRGCTGAGGPGGSGGGGGANPGTTGGTGNTPPVSPPQGNDGGGGATACGTDPSGPQAGMGGAGATSNINNTPTAYAGGGGGGAYANPAGGGCGGAGGGGPGGSPPGNGVAGTANTGGGGGGASTQGPDNTQRSGGAGGSGIVIIRYKYQ